jgi:hypothetical protein
LLQVCWSEQHFQCNMLLMTLLLVMLLLLVL